MPVELEQQGLVAAQPREHGLGDTLIAARRQPMTFVVTAAKVQRETHRRLTLRQPLDQLHAGREQSFRVDAVGKPEAPYAWIHQRGELRRIDLDVAASEPTELGDLIAQNAREVFEQL